MPDILLDILIGVHEINKFPQMVPHSPQVILPFILSNRHDFTHDFTEKPGHIIHVLILLSLLLGNRPHQTVNPPCLLPVAGADTPVCLFQKLSVGQTAHFSLVLPVVAALIISKKQVHIRRI